MKKLTLATLMIFIIAIAKAQTVDVSRFKQKYSYAGIKLGDTVTNIRVKTTPAIGSSKPDTFGKTSYTVTSDSLFIINGNVVFNSITIDCIDNKI